MLGTAGERVFPVLLIVGLLSRFAASLVQHCLWGPMLLTVPVAYSSNY